MVAKGNRGQQQQKKIRKCPLCPSGQQREISEGREACLEHMPDYTIRVSLSSGKAASDSDNDVWSILVTTFKNGQSANLKFMWSIDGQGFTSVTTGTGGDSGSAVLTVPFSNIKRTARFELIGGQAEPQILEIPANQAKLIQPKIDTSVQPVEHSLTADLSDTGSDWQIFVQTYKNGNQVSCQFVWQLDGQSSTTEKTADGTNSSEPIGTKTIRLVYANDDRVVTFHLIGAEVNTKKGLKIPSKRRWYIGPGVDDSQSLWQNFMRGLCGR